MWTPCCVARKGSDVVDEDPMALAVARQGGGASADSEDERGAPAIVRSNSHEQHLEAIAKDQNEVQDCRLMKVWEDRRALAMDLVVLAPLLVVSFVARSLDLDRCAMLADSSVAVAVLLSFFARQGSWGGSKEADQGSVVMGPNKSGAVQGTAELEAAAVAKLMDRFKESVLDGGCRVDAATCRRFLRAWKGDAAGAARGLERYVVWRRENRPAEITRDDVQAEWATRKGFAHGMDRYGHPIFWAFAARHNKNHRDVEETVKLILYNMEEAIRIGQKHGGAETICLVFDLTDFSTKNMDYEVVRRLFSVLADFYPERLARVLLWNAPAIFNGFWVVISPFIDPVSFQKVRFVSGEAITDSIHPSNLPEAVALRLGIGPRARLPSK